MNIRKKRMLSILGFVTLAAGAASFADEVALPLHENRDAFTPAAAFGNGVYLVAWQSGRTGPGDLRDGLKLIGDIVACRVDKSGKPLDAKPFVVCAAPDQQEDVHVAFGPGSPGVFLVVWQDMRNGKDWDVYAARVDPDGKVLDSDGILIADGPPSSPGGLPPSPSATAGQAAAASHNQAKPRVVWDGKTFVVVWQDFRDGNNYAMYTARVSLDGKVLDAGGVKVASGGFYHCLIPALASAGDGSSFVVHIASGLPVNNYRAPLVQGWFIRAGKPDGTAAYTLNEKNNSRKKEDGAHGPDHRGDPMAMAATPSTNSGQGGGNFLLTWKNDSSLGRGFGPNGNGALFDGQGKRIANLSFSGGKGKRDPKRICTSDVTWNGSSFVVAWHEVVREKQDGCPSDAVFVQKVSADGKKQGEVSRVAGTFANPASSPAVAGDGAGAAIVAYEKHPDKGDVPIAIAVQLVP